MNRSVGHTAEAGDVGGTNSASTMAGVRTIMILPSRVRCSLSSEIKVQPDCVATACGSMIEFACARLVKKLREFQPSSDRSSSWFPLTQYLANRAIVRSTISVDLETMIDLRLKRPNQWRC